MIHLQMFQLEDPGPGPVPETPEYYNGRQARLDIFTDNSYDNDPEPVLSGNITDKDNCDESFESVTVKDEDILESLFESVNG